MKTTGTIEINLSQAFYHEVHSAIELEIGRPLESEEKECITLTFPQTKFEYDSSQVNKAAVYTEVCVEYKGYNPIIQQGIRGAFSMIDSQSNDNVYSPEPDTLLDKLEAIESILTPLLKGRGYITLPAQLLSSIALNLVKGEDICLLLRSQQNWTIGKPAMQENFVKYIQPYTNVPLFIRIVE